MLAKRRVVRAVVSCNDGASRAQRVGRTMPRRHDVGGCGRGLHRSSDRGRRWARRELGCVDLGGRSNDGLLTHVALSVEGNAGWLIVDGDTYTSDDGGKTWSTP